MTRLPCNGCQRLSVTLWTAQTHHSRVYWPRPGGVRRQRAGGIAQPLVRRLIILQQRAHLGEALLVVIVHPGDLTRGHELGHQHVRLEGHVREVLESKVLHTSELILRSHLLDDEHVLVAHAEGALLVVARLVGEGHALLQPHLVGGLAHQAHAVRALVHVQERPNAVAGAVAVVEPCLPHRRAHHCVQHVAGGATREDRLVQGNVRLHDAREAPLLVL
mmetsp:Transcript_3887/g.8019  ORF Transcript_3887/g.8019 Transcript_3887/m.8019 type:complete len:219 (+) Transcript_3887:109-765(+)